MIAPYDGKKPAIPGDSFIAESASVIGDVLIGAGSSVWFGAVLRGDCGPVSIGKNTNVQDNCVIHADHGGAVSIGDKVTVGHCAILHGCTVSDNVLVGMNATILNGAKINRDSIIGAGSLVTQGKEFPERSLILGSPAKAVRQLSDEEVRSIQDSADGYAILAKKYARSL